MTFITHNASSQCATNAQHRNRSTTGLIVISHIFGYFEVTLPGVMIEQGMLGKNGAARAITPGNEVNNIDVSYSARIYQTRYPRR